MWLATKFNAWHWFPIIKMRTFVLTLLNNLSFIEWDAENLLETEGFSWLSFFFRQTFE